MKLIHFGIGGIDNLVIYNSIVDIERVNIPFPWWGNEDKWFDIDYVKSYMNLFDGIEICVDYRQGIYIKSSFYKSIIKMFNEVKCIFPLKERKELLFFYWKEFHMFFSGSKNKNYKIEFSMGEFLHYLFRDISLIRRVIKSIGSENVLFVKIDNKNSKNKISEFLGMKLDDFKIKNQFEKIKKEDVKILVEFERGFKKHKEYIDQFFEIFTSKYVRFCDI